MIYSNSEKIQELHRRLSEASRIVIATHMKPDGDAIGSSLGLYHTLGLYGKKGEIVISDAPASNLDFLISDDVRNDMFIYENDRQGTIDAISGSDLIICLDFNAFHRTDTLERHLKESTAGKILIDHHLSPDSKEFDLVFSETEISSASELLYHILKSLPLIGNDVEKLPRKAAVALMTGMTTDTNNFANSVYPSTLTMASDLIAAGVDRDLIIQKIYNCFRESRLRLQGHILKDLMTITRDNVAYVILDKATLELYDVQEGDTEGFVNIPLSIDRVIMSILVKEDDGKARISIRSKKGTSANRCARLHFNGGGHENAAGGRLYIPADIANIRDAAEYIEKYTHIFITQENE